MSVRPSLAIFAGAVLSASLAAVSATVTVPGLIAGLEQAATREARRAGAPGLEMRFAGLGGLASRHPTLSGGDALDDQTRLAAARAIGAIPGVGGVRWSHAAGSPGDTAVPIAPLHCQEDVNALLRVRSIRFDEGRSRIDAASRDLLDEVAAALRPCLGSIIAITGHTDSRGSEAANLALSRERADAVLAALVARGIPADGLRARGVGSATPVDGLLPEDPANRRIEFSVVATMPLQPTPIDTPSAR